MTYPVTFIEEPAHEYEFNDARYFRIGVIDGNYVLELHDPKDEERFFLSQILDPTDQLKHFANGHVSSDKQLDEFFTQNVTWHKVE